MTDDDALSTLLRRLRFEAKVFLRADYCGVWAVDTSGERHIPFHLVTHGEGWLHMAGSAPRPMRPGHLVLFPNDAAHLLASTQTPPDPSVINQGPPVRIEGDTTTLVCGYFALDRRAAMPLLSSLPDTMLLDLTDTEDSGASAAVQLWMREAAADRLGTAVAIDLLATLVFIHVLRIEVAAGRVKGVTAALSNPRIGPVLAAIHADPGGEHGIGTMASKAGMSESAFNTEFRDQVGMPPGQYVRHWRMHTAARELTTTERSMADIAAEVGYESEAAFRKAFKAFFDETPGSYRRNEGQSPD